MRAYDLSGPPDTALRVFGEHAATCDDLDAEVDDETAELYARISGRVRASQAEDSTNAYEQAH